MSVKGSEAFVFITRKEVSNHWEWKSRSLRSCIDLHWFLLCSRIWPFLLLPGRTSRTWTILWTEGLLSKSGHGMATPALLMEVDNNDNLLDIINCVALYYEKGASGNAFLPKEKFRAPVSRQVKTLKVVKETVRWVDLSLRVQENSREVWVSMTSISLYIQYPGIWTLCPALQSSKGSHFGWRSKLPAWKGVRIWSCYSIQ